MRPPPCLPLVAITMLACSAARPTAPAGSAPTEPVSSPSAAVPSAAPSGSSQPPVVGIPRFIHQGGHSGELSALAWNKAGTLVATASQHEGVRLWTLDSGSAIATLRSPQTDPSGVAWGPDGRSLAVANWTGVLEIWDLAELRPRVAHRDHQGAVHAVAYTPDGGLLLSGGQDATVYVYETRAQKLRGRITGLPAAVYALAFSPDGSSLACSSGSKVQLRETGTWRPLHALEGHSKPVTSLAWSADGRAIATGSEDGRVIVWNAERGTETLRIDAGANVQDVAWGAHQELIAAGLGDGSVRLWKTQSGEKVRQWQGGAGSSPLVSFQPGSANLAIGHGGLVIRDALSDRTILEIAAQARPGLVAWDPAADRLLIAGADGAAAVVEVDRMAASPLPGLERITAASWSRSGSRLALASATGELRVVSPGDGSTIASYGERIANPLLALSPDGNTVAWYSAGSGVQLWPVGSKTSRPLQGGPVRLHAVAWSPDGSQVALAGETADVRLWSGSGAKELARLPADQPLSAIAFGHDGRRMAASERDTGRVRVWDAVSRRVIATLEGPGHAQSVAFSPDGRWIAAAGPESGVRVWESQSGKLRLASDQGSNGLSWHHAGRVIAVGGAPALLLRVEDDEPLWVEAGSVGQRTLGAMAFSIEGLHEGTAPEASKVRFRVGSGAVHFGMLSVGQLPESYVHAGLMRAFLEGRPMPHPQAGVAAGTR